MLWDHPPVAGPHTRRQTLSMISKSGGWANGRRGDHIVFAIPRRHMPAHRRCSPVEIVIFIPLLSSPRSSTRSPGCLLFIPFPRFHPLFCCTTIVFLSPVSGLNVTAPCFLHPSFIKFSSFKDLFSHEMKNISRPRPANRFRVATPPQVSSPNKVSRFRLGSCGAKKEEKRPPPEVLNFLVFFVIF